jgi:hypothetical protein
MKELLSAEKSFFFLLHTQCGKEKEGNRAKRKRKEKNSSQTKDGKVNRQIQLGPGTCWL